jgi:VIT family
MTWLVVAVLGTHDRVWAARRLHRQRPIPLPGSGNPRTQASDQTRRPLAVMRRPGHCATLDGLVNILGIILGVIAGGGSTTVLLATGFAAGITESISMGAVGHTSSLSQRDYYQAEQAREAAEIATMPHPRYSVDLACGAGHAGATMIATRVLEQRPAGVLSAGAHWCSDAVATALPRTAGARI